MRLVMIGNCQIEALLGLYRRFAGASVGMDILYIRSYEELGAEQRRAIEMADVIVEQVQDFKPKADVAGVETRAERIGVPVVHGGFLWPFAGQPHPANPSRPFRDAGPYGSESSDSFLNRLVKRGATPEEALATYLALDVNAIVSLDRLLEISLEKQHARDALTGFSIAPVIEEHFRDEPLFLTPYHPAARVARTLATQFFVRLDVDEADTLRMQRMLRVTPFPKEELPVHPAVARHFGLSWADPARRYRFLCEGRFTFSEFVKRYVSCVWNEALDEGMDAERRGDLALAHDRIVAGLHASPDSAEGHATLGHVLERLGKPGAALRAVDRAVELAPESAAIRLQRAMLHRHAGALDSAEHETRLAAAIDPFEPHYSAMLANLLGHREAFNEAAAVARHGIVCAPYAAELWAELGHAMTGLDDLVEAETAFRRASELRPEEPSFQISLADALEPLGRHEEVAEALQEAFRLRPYDPALGGRLARTLVEAGRPEDAEQAWRTLSGQETADAAGLDAMLRALIVGGQFDDAAEIARRAIVLHPSLVSFRRILAQILERQGSRHEALREIDEAMLLAPADANILIQRGDMLEQMGRTDEAEQAFRAALAQTPEEDRAHAYGQLGHVLSRTGRHGEAIALRERASALQPDNPHRRAQLGHVLAAAGLLGPAEREISTAIAIAPGIAAFHMDLSHVLDRANRPEDALSAIGRGLALEPGNARMHAHYAHLLERAQSLEQAEAAYRFAVALTPRDTHTRLQLCRLLVRLGRPEDARMMVRDGLDFDRGDEALSAFGAAMGAEAVDA